MGQWCLLSSHILAFALAAVCIFSCLINIAQAANATTDPSEARALNAIFSKWSISADKTKWNISGELCSGNAIDSSTTIDDNTFNPFIKCDCSFNNKTTCHITALKVYAIDVVGEIPEELWTLTYLTNLNLGQNYLTGSIPAAIGNLTRMQYLSMGINSFSGELPKELGNLTSLIVLGFGSNNLSGSLPSELGNLVKLEQLYFDSSGISGPIPSTFASLKNLATVWASDMELTGSIPEFIGNWSKLKSLRFQGNSFGGPIPSSFSNLTSLTELRISELSNGSSSLDFIRNMKSLTILDLRNNNISGSIPSVIGEFHNLTQLDLSFNNITGQIPGSIFNLTSLSYLFLGNNKLSGTLPTQISSSLANIDLSYNDLSGSFPSWVNQPNLQLNFVANNFTVSSNSSGLPTGLNCLQKNFPCNSGTGRYSDFAIKCGGPQITAPDGTVYETENATLGPATYFVTDTNRWGVSNVGLFTGNSNPLYKSFVSNQFTGTVNSELFQTARLSASSLRYYGLGLENGFYNITLQFSETAILDTTTWKSLGRRVFDIYLQGSRFLKDFDIQKEAGGVSYRSVQRQFRVQVSENYLEIHLFWAGKGTCCIPSQGTYGPLIQAISAIPDFIPTVSNKPPSSNENRAGLIAGVVIGVGVVCFLSVIAIFYVIRRRKRLEDEEELLGIDTKPYTFSYSELKNATNDFNLDNKLGEGGFGPVYKGTLNDGRVVAVKQLSAGSHQGKSQFITEIATISAVQHRNLVKLYGCCINGSKRLLVYEYLENKSLDQALFGKSLNLNWSTRFDILLGVARGLTYLHEESRLRIVHRDVKASNILLDYELVPKISDFGLAKLYDDKKTHISTGVAGTIGYLAPEYAMRGHLTEKADVFSFGVVALELVSGRPNADTSLEGERMYLLEWAWKLYENDRILDLVDSGLSEFNKEEVKRLVGIALLCTQTSPTLRPPMSRVVAMISGDIEVSAVTSRPGYLSDWKFDDVSHMTSMMTDTTTKGSDTSYYQSSSGTSIVGGTDHSRKDDSKAMLHEILNEGRYPLLELSAASLWDHGMHLEVAIKIKNNSTLFSLFFSSKGGDIPMGEGAKFRDCYGRLEACAALLLSLLGDIEPLVISNLRIKMQLVHQNHVFTRDLDLASLYVRLLNQMFIMERSWSHIFSFSVSMFCCLVKMVPHADAANATTDPSEVRALNAIFSKWGISANKTQWNTSGDPCSGKAIDPTTTIDDFTYNPFITCNCSYDNKTVCHITALKVYALTVVGEIPEELWTLTHITNLNLGQNYLTGSLPTAIGNLTRMQYFTVGINALSGELPKELGNLTNLIALSFGSNNFSGSLPYELGNLIKLEQLYFDSSGISGPIPSSFANLKNLTVVWATDMELTGSIPDFIGNWSNLQKLRFQGNSFEGPIPSSFSNLTSLTELRINDLSNGSSSLAFLRNMKSLTVLELRNNNISGSIPSIIGEFQELSQLDLSFNQLTGQIPESIFNLSSLSYLFLGNNKLSGTLPTQKSSTLLNIDLSYNNLSGSIPSWVNQPNLQLNVVVNYLTIESSNSSGLPTGLNCLQKNFPCNSGTGRYSDFAIKCGGPQFTATDGTVYEMDNATLGPATYFVTDTKRWAVSNVGLFTGRSNNVFKSSVVSDFFQTARLSASSLRYYGLGLENGFYNLTLQFSEIAILDSTTTTWKNVGRRVFDIYVQGTRVFKDFNIQKEAGGISYRSVQRQVRVQVSENYLDIHLFWAGKGTCCIPEQGTYGPLISAISAIPDFKPTVSNKPPSSDEPPSGNEPTVTDKPPNSKSSRAGLIAGIVGGVGVASFLSILAIFYINHRRKRRDDNEELLGIDTKPYTFSYSELKNATDDFIIGNKLGEGGFGPVYKGTLDDGRVVAVKQLSVGSHQGKNQFITEIATISSVRHRNLVKLYGCCIEGSKRLIVYEYLENKSLDQILFGMRIVTLSWSTRYDICLGLARGLTYLHEESPLRIVHRDVKASNILLDSELVPKISDFGLAKLYDDKKTHISTRVAGTIGYLAPEYAMRGHLTEKADVFSFGVVALEVVSGRPNSDSSLEGDKIYLLEWAWNLHERNSITELMDPRLSEVNVEEVNRIVGVALLCTQTAPSLRPSMSRVVAMLTGDIEVSTVISRPGYLTEWNFNDVSSFMTDMETKESGTSNYNLSPSTATVDSANRSPIDDSKPILHETWYG
ncbi:PREDICTED: uncharacterized protein LOC109352863 [Lupinus angustifolius]|uniref:uncharacterized protein LOC109352863 n=1 Tax=Lupinus angustifolius TaxID=3871 RepID=UPI00092E518E|nr:PREDICTED: uncharacterized protein LOC109352863 [Lupinus angustifolius]